MPQTIYKYELPIQDRVTVDLPVGAKILNVETQIFGIEEKVFLWALVNPEATLLESAKFHLYGTGHPITQDGKKLNYVGTVHMKTASLVWHVFQESSLTVTQ